MDQHGTTQLSIEAKIYSLDYDLEINPVIYYDSHLVSNALYYEAMLPTDWRQRK